MNSSTNPDEIMRIFKSGDVAAQQAFIDKCPPSSMRETALIAAGLERPESGIMALDILAMDYAQGTNCELGAEIAKSCYELAIEAFKIHGAGPANVYLLSAGRSAISCVTALQRLGRHEELLTFAKDAIIWLEQARDTENLPFLRLYSIEANIDLMHYNTAQKLLNEAKDLQFTPAEHMKLQGLENRLKEIMKIDHELPPTEPIETILAEQRRQMLDGALNVILDIGPEYKVIIDVLKKRLVAESETPKSKAEIFASISEALDYATNRLSKSGELNEWGVMKLIRDATSIFLDRVKGQDAETIEKSLGVLKTARDWSKANNFPQHENDALWGLHLCYSRLGRKAEDLKVLQALRANVEKARGQILEPHERAGVMTKFPYLFPVLCQLLYRLNRPADLLDAMEGAKGRVLADALSQHEGRPVMDQIFSEPAQKLPTLMQHMDAHYLSYFVDDEETYAVLVARDGSIHSHSIPLSKTKLRDIITVRGEVNDINPKFWGMKEPTDLFGGKRIPNDIPDQLAPLVDWLEPFAESGLLRKDDHICYSPDEHLHLIPLHYVSFRGEPLVRYVSLSRIHGARALVILLDEKSRRPNQFTAVQVPARQDLTDSKTITAFNQVPEWLKERLPGDVAAGEHVDLDTVAQLHLSQRVVHFATHGTFPHEGLRRREPNPYRSSGLALAEKGQLPDKALIAQGEADNSLLTPQKVLDLGLDLSGSHVTMQACVSGLSKEGIGRDALGLEWALLQAGANSLLASHWNVSVDSSADFSLRFYQRWLLDKASRAVAWRETVLELMDSQEAFKYPKPYYWAPFSLSGDWR